MKYIQTLLINLLLVLALPVWSAILPANLTQVGLFGQINIYDKTNNIIKGTGEPGATIIVQATNYQQTASNTCKYPGQYIGLGSIQDGITNPETSQNVCKPYTPCNPTVGNYIGEVTNGSAKFYTYTTYTTSSGPYIVKQDAYMSPDQIEFFKSDIISLFMVENGCFVGTKKSGQTAVYGSIQYPVNVLITNNIVQVETNMVGFVTLNSVGYATAYGPYSGGFNVNVQYKKIFAGGYGLYGGLTIDNTLLITGVGLDNQVQLSNINIQSIQWTYTGGRIKTTDNVIIYFGNTDTTSQEFPENLTSIQVDSTGNWAYVLTSENFNQLQTIKAKHLILTSVNGLSQNYITALNVFNDSTLSPTNTPTIKPTVKPTSIPTPVPSLVPTLNVQTQRPSFKKPTAIPTSKSYPSFAPTMYVQPTRTKKPTKNMFCQIVCSKECNGH